MQKNQLLETALASSFVITTGMCTGFLLHENLKYWHNVITYGINPVHHPPKPKGDEHIYFSYGWVFCITNVSLWAYFSPD